MMKMLNFRVKKAVIHSSKMFATIYKTTWHHNPEDHDKQIYIIGEYLQLYMYVIQD
jgi:hypothetical protein